MVNEWLIFARSLKETSKTSVRYMFCCWYLNVFDAICSSASYGSGWPGESSKFASLFFLRQGCPVGATRKHSGGRWFSSGTAEIWEDTWAQQGPANSTSFSVWEEIYIYILYYIIIYIIIYIYYILLYILELHTS